MSDDLARDLAHFRELQSSLSYKIQRAAQEVGTHARLQQREYLRQDPRVHTKTGLERLAKGGQFAGRYDTGHMHWRIEDDVKTTGKGKAEVTVGWIQGMREYEKIQEFGTDRIAGANSIAQGFLAGKEKANEVTQKLWEEIWPS